MCDFPFFFVSGKIIFLGDSKNDLKTLVFLVAVESAVDVDVQFKDPPQNENSWDNPMFCMSSTHNPPLNHSFIPVSIREGNSTYL